MAPSPAAAGRTGRNNNNDAGLADPLLPGGGGGGGKDKYWVPADGEEEEEEICRGEDGGRPPAPPLLYLTFKVSGVLLHPYRWVCALLPSFLPSCTRVHVCCYHCVSSISSCEILSLVETPIYSFSQFMQKLGCSVKSLQKIMLN